MRKISSIKKNKEKIKKMGLRKIDPDINMSELIENYPEVTEVLMFEYGLHCINCVIAGLDTLREGAAVHGIEGEDFNDLIKHLEKIINK